MNLDIRIPIGGMFSLFGLLLLVYGLATAGSPMYEHSLNINVNAMWGGVLLVFGAVMLGFGLRGKPASAAPTPGDPQDVQTPKTKPGPGGH